MRTEQPSPTPNLYLGHSTTDAFYEAMRRWGSQRDSDPNRLETAELVEQVFAEYGLTILADSATRPLPPDAALRGALADLLKWAERFLLSRTVEDQIALMASTDEARLALEAAATGPLPPDADENHHCCSGCDAEGHCTHGLPAAWYGGYDRGVRNATEYHAATGPLDVEAALLSAMGNLTKRLLISQDGESVSGETGAVLWLREVIRLSAEDDSGR